MLLVSLSLAKLGDMRGGGEVNLGEGYHDWSVSVIAGTLVL